MLRPKCKSEPCYIAHIIRKTLLLFRPGSEKKNWVDLIPWNRLGVKFVEILFSRHFEFSSLTYITQIKNLNAVIVSLVT